MNKEKKQNEKRIKIGIDIDDVLLHSLEDFLKFYNKKFNQKIKREQCVSDKRLHECFGITKEKLILLYKEYEQTDNPLNVERIEGAERVLSKIKNECDFILITGRPETIEKQTRAVLNKKFPNHNFEVVFTNKDLSIKKNKGDVCVEKGVSLFVEDDWKNALDCAKKEIHVLLLDKPWNKGVKHKNITRVYDWKEISEKINRFNNKKLQQIKNKP